jgi:hypothetical protein
MNTGPSHKQDEPENQPDNQDENNLSEPSVTDETIPGGHGKHRVRRKIRVRKRIRIRKKPSSKKKIKKYAERAFWILLIAGFITALIIMVIELDIRDDRLKKARPAKKTTRTSTF